MILSTLVCACRIVNDRVKTRLPIQVGLLEIILFELQRLFKTQPYLENLYKAIFIVAYYGLFRVGELTDSRHTIKAKDVHIGKNKNKMLFILYSSKTHGKESKPQKIKISEVKRDIDRRSVNQRLFCPFKISREYLSIRGNYKNDNDPFFVFRDQSAVTAQHARNVLRSALKALNLNPHLYNFMSLRSGRATDMFVKYNYTIEQVKAAGRWKSNAVFKICAKL